MLSLYDHLFQRAQSPHPPPPPPRVLRAGVWYSLCPEGLNAERSGLENERTVFGNSSSVGWAAVSWRDGGLGKEGGRVSLSARQSASLPGAAGAKEAVAMRHSCSGGRTGSRLGAGWELGPSPCSGERKEAVGRGGAEASEVSRRQKSNSWDCWAGCPKVEAVLRFSSCPGKGEGAGQLAACGGWGAWPCRVGRGCCLWGGPAGCHLGAEQAGVSEIAGLFGEAF